MSSYAEKYRDPRWQRRRLEIMSAAGFACQECGDKGTTLNVHHKQYHKGADPWEYHESELLCLCENCHKTHHDHKKAIEKQLAGCALYELPYIHALIAGYTGEIPLSVVPAEHPDWATTELFPGDEIEHTYQSGVFASTLCDLSSDGLRALAEVFELLGPDGLGELMRETLENIRRRGEGGG